MAISFQLSGEVRDDNGKGASRRLRRLGQVPAILYGAGADPLALSLNHNELQRNLEHEAFYSHILNINVGKQTHQAILKDIQRHPSKRQIMHLDLQRVSANHEIRVHVPLHFTNEASAVGVKLGGVLSHHIVDVEVDCLPKDLPEFIEVDVGALEMGATLHLSDLKLPQGVKIVALSHGPEHDKQVASIHHARVSEEPEETAPAEEEAKVEVEAKGKTKAEGGAEK